MNDCKIHVLWKAKIHSSWGFHFAFSSITKLKRLNPVSCNKRNIWNGKSIFRRKSERHQCFCLFELCRLKPSRSVIVDFEVQRVAWHLFYTRLINQLGFQDLGSFLCKRLNVVIWKDRLPRSSVCWFLRPRFAISLYEHSFSLPVHLSDWIEISHQ